MNPKLQIVLFILFAGVLFAFIRFSSANPGAKEYENNKNTIAQTTLPTQAAATGSETATFTSADGLFSFEYPDDWVSTTSALLVPDTDLGVTEETAIFMAPDSTKGVLVQTFPNKNILPTNTPYLKTVDAKGLTRIRAIREKKIYSLKILGPADGIVTSISAP